METPILVAIIGGVVTIVGFVISGLFGVLASTSQREAAASLGVEKALNERLEGKDDHIRFLEAKIESLESDKAKLQELTREQHEKIASQTRDIYQCEQEKQRLEQAMMEENGRKP